jgi:diacylglycerol kinase family enzyme
MHRRFFGLSRASPSMPNAPLFIVLNPGSGRQSPSETCGLIETVLGSAGRPFVVQHVDRTHDLQTIAHDAAERAHAARGILVAAGGDGTVSGVAHAALTRGCHFGLLPCGTFNYFSRTHGIPSDTAAALQVLLTGTAHPVQLGLVNDRIFAVNASLGLYPQVLEDREAYKQQYGRRRSVALFAALLTLLRGQRQMRLRLEVGAAVRELRTLTLFIGNNRLQLQDRHR